MLQLWLGCSGTSCYDISTEAKRVRLVGHSQPGPAGQFYACQREDGRMGVRTASGQRRHSYNAVAGPATALREVIARRSHIGGSTLVGVSKRVELLPAILRRRLDSYWYRCLSCKFQLESEVAREMWPMMQARLASIGGTLGAWLLRAKDHPMGGWVYNNLRYRQLGDAENGAPGQRVRTAIEVFRKTREEHDARGVMFPTRGRLRTVRREWEVLGSKAAESQRFSVRDIFGK